jgi:hypothetical protein
MLWRCDVSSCRVFFAGSFYFVMLFSKFERRFNS